MDKLIKRNIKLIQLLYSYNRFVSVSELASAMKLSDKTIKLELEYLSDYLKDNDYGLFLNKQASSYYLERLSVHYIEKLLLNLKKKKFIFSLQNVCFIT